MFDKRSTSKKSPEARRAGLARRRRGWLPNPERSEGSRLCLFLFCRGDSVLACLFSFPLACTCRRRGSPPPLRRSPFGEGAAPPACRDASHASVNCPLPHLPLGALCPKDSYGAVPLFCLAGEGGDREVVQHRSPGF
jgi:hypothetical protein